MIEISLPFNNPDPTVGAAMIKECNTPRPFVTLRFRINKETKPSPH